VRRINKYKRDTKNQFVELRLYRTRSFEPDLVKNPVNCEFDNNPSPNETKQSHIEPVPIEVEKINSEILSTSSVSLSVGSNCDPNNIEKRSTIDSAKIKKFFLKPKPVSSASLTLLKNHSSISILKLRPSRLFSKYEMSPGVIQAQSWFWFVPPNTSNPSFWFLVFAHESVPQSSQWIDLNIKWLKKVRFKF